jgi:ribosomal protein S18 acetylase RimI-like enzyme
LSAGSVTVRPFQAGDLEAAARFCEQARAKDASIEPFAQRIGIIATGPRAVLDLWRVAEGEDRRLYGIAFAALRDARERTTFDLYAAVDPSMRRQGLGRALCETALSWVAQSTRPAVLRARVRDDSAPGRAFLASMGFNETSAQLSLTWNGREKPLVPEMPALRLRKAEKKDQKTLERLSTEAWAGAADAFASRADEIAQLFAEEGKLALVAESEGRPMGYFSGVFLGRTLGIEEVAVLPEFRRMGVARALVAHALGRCESAVLSVSESNKPARALYRSFGFTQTVRRVVMELRNRRKGAR